MKKIKIVKRLLVVAVCTVACLVLLGTGTVIAVRAVAEKNSIGRDTAAALALADAGLSGADAAIAADAGGLCRTEFEYEDGRFVYDVLFTVAGTSYEYRLRAADGALVRASRRSTDLPDAVATGTDRASVTPSVTLTEEQARDIALADVGLSVTDVTFGGIELDTEHGIRVYEIDFYTSDAEYEYEIDAATGDIRGMEKEIRLGDRHTDNRAPVTPDVAKLTEDEAHSIALADAGVAAADATFDKTKLERDDGMLVYDIDFRTAEYEYDYEIDAVTGDIISRDKDSRNTSGGTDGTPDGGTHNAADPITPDAVKLTEDEAHSIALADAGVAADDATFDKTKLDRDDGVLTYDVEFHTAEFEYDYEIDAVTGDIISRDRDSCNTSGGTPGDTEPPVTKPVTDPAAYGNVIGIDAAKAAALSHAGLTGKESLVTFGKAKLEDDRDGAEYEIEFFYNGLEYDYEINALTGDVTDYDVEKDD